MTLLTFPVEESVAKANPTLLERCSQGRVHALCKGYSPTFSGDLLQRLTPETQASEKGDVLIEKPQELHPSHEANPLQSRNGDNFWMQQVWHVLHAFHDPDRRERCSVSALSLDSTVNNWDGESAPFSYQPLTVSAALWPFVLVVFAWTSIACIHSGCRSVAWLMLTYESYIIFDHLPFLFTNELYSSARVNFEHTDLTAFWGMEATSTIISFFAVGSPWWVMGNIPNHVSFIFFNYRKQVATSETFQYGRKRWYLVLGVAFDTSLHCVSALFYMKHLLGDGIMCWVLWVALNIAMTLLTMWVHYDYMHWGHLLVHFGFRPSSKLA